LSEPIGSDIIPLFGFRGHTGPRRQDRRTGQPQRGPSQKL